MSSSMELQEDHFDDIDSDFDDDRLSNYENECIIDGHTDVYASVDDQKRPSASACIVDRSPPNARLSTIAEESHLATDDIRSQVSKALSVNSMFGKSFANMNLSKSDTISLTPNAETFQPMQSAKERLERDQQSFFRANLLSQNDWRFNQSHIDKERSWEPSIHNSPAPAPRINVDKLAALNETDSFLAVQNSVHKDNAIENTPPMRKRVGSMNEMERCLNEPKSSTPNSFSNKSLRNWSMNGISAIQYQNSPMLVRRQQTKKGAQRFQTVAEEETTLSNSVIGKVLATDDLDDTALVNALVLAKSRLQLQYNLRNQATGERNVEVKAPNVFQKDDYMNKTPLRSDSAKKQRKSANKEPTRPANVSYEKNAQGAGPNQKYYLNGITNTATASTYRASSTFERSQSEGKYLSCETSFLYFGFVDINCPVNRSVRLHNTTSKKLNVKLKMKSDAEGFRLLEEGVIVLKAQEEFYLHIVFEPSFGACYRNTLQITVLNAEHVVYALRMLGNGGLAMLCVNPQPTLDMRRDGSFVMTTPGVNHINFMLENRGARDSFVRITVLDGHSRQPIKGCTIRPSGCYTLLRRQKLRIKIDMENCLDMLQTVKGSRTASTYSSTNHSAPENVNYFVQLLWGEEAQRRRVKRYEHGTKANFLFHEHTFTKCRFDNEQNSKPTASENVAFGLHDQDAFELGLRITLISVVDNRVSSMSQSRFTYDNLSSQSVWLERDATMQANQSQMSVIQDVTTFPSPTHPK